MDKQKGPKRHSVTKRGAKPKADRDRAKNEEIELTDDDLRQVSGGEGNPQPPDLKTRIGKT